jgi:hypothetical protein
MRRLEGKIPSGSATGDGPGLRGRLEEGRPSAALQEPVILHL